VLATSAAIGWVLAQGLNPPGGNSPRRYRSPYDPKTHPPVGLEEAYLLAAGYLGEATNRLHCVSASCLEVGRSGFPGWTFSWCDTNGERTYVEVTFDKEVYPDTKIQGLLDARNATRPSVGNENPGRGIDGVQLSIRIDTNVFTLGLPTT